MRHLRAGWTSRSRVPALILMYHRIAADGLDPWRLCVTPQNFARHLGWLSRYYRVVPLRRLAAELVAGNLQGASVAISFDDGYAQNLLTGEPLLRKFGLPATYFITTSLLGSACEFWWDELERLLMNPQRLPATLQVSLDGETRAFHAGRASGACDPMREFHSVRPWQAETQSRLGFYYKVWSSLRPLEEPARKQALAQIRAQLGGTFANASDRRTLTHDEVRRLAASPGADIGAHSVTHSAFSRRTPMQQRWEMTQSKQELEALTARPIHGFAYPYGDYGSDGGAQSASMAREAGFEFACTTDGIPISRNTPVHLLPRIGVEDWDEPTFAAQVRRMLR